MAVFLEQILSSLLNLLLDSTPVNLSELDLDLANLESSVEWKVNTVSLKQLSQIL